MDPVGTTVTNDRELIYALDADVVVYTGRALPDETGRHEEMVRLLRSGKNVVTSTAYFFPWQRGAEYVAPLEAACAAGSSTLHGTGVHPGWFVERVGLSVTSLCTQVDSVEFAEIADLSHHAGEAVRGIGFGALPEKLGSTKRKTILSRYYFEMIAHVAHALGVRLERMGGKVRYIPSRKRFDVAAVRVEEGTVAGVDGTWIGYRDGEPMITMRVFWYLDPDLVDFTEITSPDIYDIKIGGKPVDVRTRVDMTVTEDEDFYGQDNGQSGANLATAVQVVQTIPCVVAAEPGILVPPVFAHAARDLRDVVSPLEWPPLPVPEEHH